MGPRQLWHDLARMARGLLRFVRHLRSEENIDIGLGTFAATSSTVVAGQPCRYMIRIANVSKNPRDVTLALEISANTPATPTARPAARFAKHCSIPASGALDLEFHYDWRSTPTVMIDQQPSHPDEDCVGELHPRQRYAVCAILCDRTGKHLESLKIYQELKQ